MITVAKKPTGRKIVSGAIPATIINGGLYAFVIIPYHIFNNANYCYIDSDVDEYNGFWYVEVVDYQSFKLLEYPGADPVPFYQELDVDVYLTQEHQWSSIFLPIIYKCTNNRWPVNNVDAPRTVTSSSDDNGFTQLTLSGVVRAEGVKMLEFVKISGGNAAVNSIWQIVEVNTSSNIVINLPYSTGNSFGTVQYYYANYQVRVKIWAGLNALHPWQAKKPYEEMAELSLTPDDDGEVMFSISDYIKSKVAIKNNLTLFSLPLNLDAFTGFYIQTAESFDQSDNYSLVTSESEFSTDTFEGYAIAGKLPFKNVYSGMYSDYVLTITPGYPAMWLTNASRLLAVEGYYFDISFIKSIPGEFWVIIDKYVADYLMSTQVEVHGDSGIGVYRIPITPDAAFDSFCVRVHTPGVPDSAIPTASLFDICDWSNVTFGWVKDAYCVWDITVNGSGGPSGWLVGTFLNDEGYSYEFTASLEIGVTGLPLPVSQVIYALLDGTFTPVDSVTFNYTDEGIKTETFSLMANTGAAYLGVFVTNNTPFASKNYSLLSVEYNPLLVPPDDGYEAQDITEEICIDILETCEAQQGFTDEDRRLLEDGEFRLLE